MKVLKAIKYILIIKIAIYLFTAFTFLHAVPETSTIIIPKNVSTLNIARILKDNDIINNEYAFAIIAYSSSKISNRYIQPGEYVFRKGTSIIGVFKKLWHGDRVIRKITVPEGYSINQIFNLINQTEGLDGLLETSGIKEGALLPDTYYYYWGDSKKSIITRMSRAMQRFLAENVDKTTALPIPKEQILILASIVEEETAIAAEKPIVAAVYLNRLKINMPLQADPTVIYAITNGNYNLDRTLNYQDLKYDSPYNTYINKGLPPAPISCPGKDSILAVLTPAETKALYFVADGKGGHNFAQDLKSHNLNVAKYKVLNQ